MPSIITASTASNTALNFSADTSGVLEIRTGSSPTMAMTIDGSQNVGIGTSSTPEKLNVYNAGSSYIRVTNTSASIDSYYGTSSIGSWIGTGTNHPVVFYTNNTERMRITSTGQVGIGTTTPGTTLNVFTGSTLEGLRIQRFAGAYYSELRQTDGPESLAFLVGDGATVAERMRISGTGAVVLQGGTTTANGVGITFPATQSASTNANTLDDYEEGTFQPSWSAVGVSFSYDPAYRHGRYTKIGNRVFYSIYISTTSAPTGTTSNPLTITGLPFTSSNADNAVNCAQTIGQFWNVDWPANKIAGVANIGRNTTTLVLNWEQDATVSAQWTAANLLASCYVMVSGFYETN